MSASLDKVEASWRNLQDAIAGIPDARMSEPGVAGEWSVKDVLAHVAYWDDPDVEDTGDEALWQPINERVAADRANWTPAQARDVLAKTHERAVAAMRAALAKDPDAELDGGHYDEHAEQIRAWRQAQGI